MKERQLRLGDILDDYCPRERRVTNHAIVAMIGPDVKQTRCTTCDAEHAYKHAKVPRQRRKADTPAALYTQVAAGAPKRVVHDPSDVARPEGTAGTAVDPTTLRPVKVVGDRPESNEGAPSEPPALDTSDGQGQSDPPHLLQAGGEPGEDEREKGPVHRPLIRASLPRPEGQQPTARPLPEFTIRQPGTRQNRFRGRPLRGGSGQPFQGHRANGKAGGRPPQTSSRPPRRHGAGRKRTK
jgi:hypothetical protein